jgi:nucleoid-associated protein YgaU
VPEAIPPEGIPYRIRWGDTLWDITEAFYRNPWLYRRIARYNDLRNPDLIVSGTEITIPPRDR